MGLTKGNLLSKIQQNHQFFIEEGLLKPFFESFTLRSFAQLYGELRNELVATGLITLPELPVQNNNVTLMDLVDNSPTCEYTAFQEATQQFSNSTTEISWENLKQIILYHENRQFNSSFPINQSYNQTIIDINNSLEKSVIITFNLNSDLYKIRLHFYDKNNRSNERKVAIKKDIMLAAAPRLPNGETYSARTLQYGRSSVDNIGAIIPTSENSTNPQDLIAAPLQVSYDESTGTFKSGNPQMLARMLEDLDPAPLEKVIEEGFSISSFTTNNAGLAPSLSQFTKANAIPLNIKAGNPNTLSPNYTDCSNKKEITVTVVNRSRKSFKRDEVVMLTEINGEWIPMTFGEDIELGGSTRFGDWSFIKMTANSDTYFMDNRFVTAGGPFFSRVITAQRYESDSRIKFYKNIKQRWNNAFFEVYTPTEIEEMYNINIGIANIDIDENTLVEPSKNYLFHTIYDQIGSAGGGKLEHTSTFLTTTNLSDPSITPDGLYVNEIPFFWGPVFIDGTSTPVNNSNLFKNLAKIWVNNFARNNIEYFTTFLNLTDDNLISQVEDLILLDENGNPVLDADGEAIIGDPDVPLFSPFIGGAPTLPQGLHVPAEAVSKIINPLYIVQNYHLLGSESFIVKRNTAIETPFYGTKINSINKIQFSPLTVDFAAADDLWAKSEYLRPSYGARNFYDYNRTLLTLLEFPFDNNFKFFKSVYDRADLYTIGTYSYLIPPPNGLKCNGIFDETKIDINNVILNPNNTVKTLLYDCYITQQPPSSIIGSPRIFRDSFANETKGANLVGIIAAKNTISKRSGGTISFSLSQDYGLNKQRTSTGSTDTISVILGVIINFATGGGLTQGIPQWGSTTDSYYDFGTTGLHVRIFDYWPEEQTVHDPRYFAVLHFNPENMSQPIFFQSSDQMPYNEIIDIYSDDTRLVSYYYSDNNIDFRVPSQLELNGDEYFVKPIPMNTIIGSTTPVIKEEGYWFVNPIRRGMLLTGSGFTYIKHVIGLNNYTIITGGTNISNQTMSIGKGAEIKIITDNGQLSSIEFVVEETGNKNVKRGEGFLPSDFAKKTTFNGQDYFGYLVTIKSDNGSNASVVFTDGIVYGQKLTDLPPLEQIPITRLSSGSKRGEDFIREGKNTDLSVERNSSGRYDCFFHFHNDVGHTPAKDDAFIAGFAQYINMTIT